MNKHVFNLAFLALLLVSCQSKLQETDGFVVAPDIIAEAEAQPGTRTLISVDNEGEGTIYWTPGDEINLFYGTTSTHYTSQNAENATTAVFRTTDIIGSTESASTNIWGLYPYNANAVCTGSAVTTTLQTSQSGVPGTFDDDLYISLAHSSTNNLRFFNVCGGIKFSLTRNDINAITFRGNNNEDLAGDISLSFVDGLPKATVVNGQKEITLTPKGGGTFAKDVNYYIIALPGTLSQGFTMTFRTSGGTVGTFQYDDAVTLKRSIFSRKAEIDTYATFAHAYSKVVFFGNSITRCPPVSGYWWGYWGEAATRPENDYVHRVMARLREDVPNATYEIATIGRWELRFANAELPYDQNAREIQDADLVIIRLGENVEADCVSQFETNLVALVNYVHLFSPNPRIVITGQFWTNAAKEAACINAARRQEVTYVQINQYDMPEYKETIGGLVYGDDGQQHAITDYMVAQHPSDLGMEKIAEAILNAVLPE